MPHEEDRRIGKLAVELGFTDKTQVDESLRILRLREDIGQPTTMDRLLFERQLLEAGEVYEVQARAGLRPALCPACPSRFNTFLRKPGSVIACPRCGHRVPVAGFDPNDPFRIRDRVSRRLAALPTRREVFLGLLGMIALAILLTKSAQESWPTHMRWPALATTAGFVALSALLARHLRFMAASSLGLALFTGLVVGSVLGTNPGTPALSVFGVGAHQLVPPLIVGFLLLIVASGGAALVRRGSTLALLALLWTGLYGLCFFVWRSLPGSDPAAYLSGGSVLPRRLPWLLHPGALTLLVLFPAAALGFLIHGLRRLQPNHMLKHAGVAAALVLLSGFGVAVGTARGEIPVARLEVKVQRALNGRLADWWRQGDTSPRRASTAAALTEIAPSGR